MRGALEEWHRWVGEYRIAPGTSPDHAVAESTPATRWARPCQPATRQHRH
jgi:hypothetical protein